MLLIAGYKISQTHLNNFSMLAKRPQRANFRVNKNIIAGFLEAFVEVLH